MLLFIHYFRMVDFIGLGAQKAGTSWVYACLYEHPEIHAPIKELHFFSRDRFGKGDQWYESHFDRREAGQKVGEFSTSYLYSKEAPSRIAGMYPNAKMIAIVRNPIKRAHSHYYNMLKAGLIPKTTTFTQFKESDDSVLGQGLYTKQLYRYLQYFSKRQLLILVYEDIEKDPAAFMKQIYEHLELEDLEFQPTMLHNKVNIARIPSWIGLERWMHKVAEMMRKIRLDKAVWAVRKSGLPDYIRGVNTKKMSYTHETDDMKLNRQLLEDYYRDEVSALGSLIGRNLTEEWKI